ncbi:MAG: G-D-S-L family lipolytic protein [Chitinophagaceae bacterium]|nr:G-D-S-L family lipolytic protein [Chitinophagaceae bacterium]
MKVIFSILTVLLTAIMVGEVQAQQPPFYNDIQRFKKADSAQFPRKGQILFIGSSSFTRWNDVQDYFPEHSIINRGFGGSSLPDLIRYADDIVFGYAPKQIVIYCGENDLAASDTVSAAAVVQRFITLFTMIREKYPRIPVAYISMKPSPSRVHLMHKMDAGNWAIKAYLQEQKKTVFVDTYHLMLDANGEPRKELFVEDRLHMNNDGYAIWQKALAPILK